MNAEILDSEEGENVNQIYYDQEEIELNQEQQKKDQFEDLMRMRRNISFNTQNQNKINIMDFLPKPKSSNGANSLSKRMKKALDDKIQREKKQGMMLD